ncbi:TRAP transporter small permease [Neobacillus niacini]|uniref:TRAP transporter small permease n=1 Tax=Neobacillus niacini TaxID=86668 RepID=UPI003B01CBA8
MDRDQSISVIDDQARVTVYDQTIKKTKSKSINLFFTMIDKMNEALAWIAGAAVVLLMLLIVFNAIKRMFSDPFAGTVEIATWLGAISGIFALGYAQLHKSHVFIDLLINKFPEMVSKIIHTLVNIVSALFFLVAGWLIFQHGLNMMGSGVVSETLRIPFYPIVQLCSLGFIGIVLAIIKETIFIWKE